MILSGKSAALAFIRFQTLVSANEPIEPPPRKKRRVHLDSPDVESWGTALQERTAELSALEHRSVSTRQWFS